MKSDDSDSSDDSDLCVEEENHYRKLLQMRRSMTSGDGLALSSSESKQPKPVVKLVEREATASLETPPPKKAKKRYHNTKSEIPQSDVSGVYFNTQNKTW